MTHWSVMAYALLSLPFLAGAQVDVLTYHNDNSRAGANLNETILTPANVNPTTFGKLFTYNVDGYVYAQPLYVSELSIPGQGTHNVVFVATEHNSVYAFDADSNSGANGGLLWHANLGNSANTPNSSLPFQAIVPEVGITGTPAIDPDSQTLYVDTFTQEGTNYLHSIHALSILDGSEKPSSPVVVSLSVPGVGAGSAHGVLPFQARQQLQRAGLTLANGVLYVAYAGYTDTQFTDPYHGWILGFDPGNLQLLPNQIFNSTPNGTSAQFGSIAGRGGIWMGGGGLAVDGNNLYFSTGDGNFNALPGANGTDYGDSVIRLNTAGGFSVSDYFTPYNQSYFRLNDLDVASGGVVVLPDQPGPFPHLLVAGGKPQRAYLINRDMMTSDNLHFNSTQDNIVQEMPLGGGSYSTPAYFNGQLYYVASKDVMRSYQLSNGTLVPDLPNSAGPRTFGFPGATPFVSANGGDNGVVWAIQNAKPAVLAAYDANNLTSEIYNSTEAPGGRDQLTDGVKFAAPIVANGKVYVGSQMALSVFGLLDSAGPPPVWKPAQTTYSGLFSQLNNVTFGTSGSASITTTKQGSYSAKLQLGTAKYSFHGKFDTSGAATSVISGKDAPQLTIALQVYTNDNSYITGTVSSSTWTANLLVNRAPLKLHSGRQPFIGKYSLTFSGPGDNNPTEPQNNGTGQATINSSGSVKFKGTLGDGTKVSESGLISQEGAWGMFISLYKNQGEITGWLIFDGTNASGQTTWIKMPDIKGKQFTNGFMLEPPVSGSTH